MTRKRKQCGDGFEPRSPRQQFCVGKNCRQTWHREHQAQNHQFDKDIPLPPSRAQFEFIHAMQPNDSRFIDCDGDTKIKHNKLRALHIYARRHGMRMLTQSEGTGFRCWRNFDKHE